MLGAVKKLMPVAAGDLGGRLGAWWNGRDYVAPAPGEGDEAVSSKPEAPKPPAKAEAKPETKPEPQPEPQPEPVVTLAREGEPSIADEPEQTMSGPAIRLKALETLWGAGRFAPGSAELDTRLLDELFTVSDEPGDIGFIGVDGAMLNACAERSTRVLRAAEWRSGCVDRLREVAPTAIITQSEVDRPRGFENQALEGLVTIEAFAYADHKAGLVGRVHRALSDTGRWVFLDTTRHSNKTPREAFASAWAEPQLATTDEIEDLLKLAGFKSVQRTSATELVLAAAREGYAQLSKVLESAAASGLSGREGALFLQELAWEAQSWRARMRALEGGALSVDLWIADKREGVAPIAEMAVVAATAAAAPVLGMAAVAALMEDDIDFSLDDAPAASVDVLNIDVLDAGVVDQAAIDSLFD